MKKLYLEEHREGGSCFIFPAAFPSVHEKLVSGFSLAFQLCHELQTWIAINPFISININTQIFFPFFLPSFTFEVGRLCAEQ